MTMATIDADTHVVETERTWDYLDPSDSHFRPIVVTVKDKSGEDKDFWLIEGKLRHAVQVLGRGIQVQGRDMETPGAAAELENVRARVVQMDELGIDMQVLYPTVFLSKMCERAEIEVALCRSYNRWIADVTKDVRDRLTWAAVLPLSVMDEALKELRLAVGQGARAVFMRSMEDDKLICDPYFYPLYEEASKLDVPIGIHIGNSNDMVCDLLSRDGFNGAFTKFRLPTVGSFHTLIMTRIPEMFPKLRIAYLEASAQWVPYALRDLKRRLENRGKHLDPDVMHNYRIYVSCQTDDDLPYILSYTGINNLVIGTDYGHHDQSTEIQGLRNLRNNEEINPEAARRILEDNPQTLYGLITGVRS